MLISLWSEGIEYPLQPSDRIRPEDVALAERATGIAANQQKRIAYWIVALGVTRAELTNTLDGMGLTLSPKANTLPKGAVRRLRALLPDIDPAQVESDVEAAPKPLADPVSWTPHGVPRDCIYLTTDEILRVHEALAADFALSDDPISPSGVKSMALLESAAHRPQTGLDRVRKYPTVESAAAALLHSLVHNHPFHNGNKRTALVSTLVFLDRHNLVFESTETDMFRFMLRVAAHDFLDASYTYTDAADREVAIIATQIARLTRPIRREERAVTWRELSRKLKQRGCTLEPGGDKVLIRRTVSVPRRFFLGSRSETYDSYCLRGGDGREVPRSQIKRLRRDLRLDADHGVDAEVFYGEQKDPDFFIHQYSTLLKRLARV